MKKKKKKKIRIKFRNIVLAVFFITFFLYMITMFLNIEISNIYIAGNNYYTDQEIIRLAKIENYPNTFTNTTNKIEKRLEKDIFILSANVKKKFFSKVYIEIMENIPLYFDSAVNKTILLNGKGIKEQFDCPILTNEIPASVKDKFLEKMSKVNIEILDRISEIKYDPDQVDNERILLTMNDGNYAYLTLSKFTEINNYINYIKEFNNKKGVLYLNSGEYFKIIEE